LFAMSTNSFAYYSPYLGPEFPAFCIAWQLELAYLLRNLESNPAKVGP
jgi:hypothetical protein